MGERDAANRVTVSTAAAYTIDGDGGTAPAAAAADDDDDEEEGE